jgi:putative ABC transport system permease protein
MTSVRHLVGPLVFRPAANDRLRFGLTISGIAVGVATMTAIRLANASVLSSFSDTVDLVAGKASITILADGPGIPEETLERLTWLRRAGATLAPVVTETAAAGAKDGEVVEVLGIDPVADPNAREYSFVSEERREGERPGVASKGNTGPLLSIFEANRVLLTEEFASRHGLRAGDSLPLVAGGVERKMIVAAVLKPEGVARAASGSILFMDLGAAQEAFGKVGRLDRIDIVLPAGLSANERSRFEEEVRASLPPGVTAGRPERRTETVDRMVRAFRVNLTALGLIALLVGVYFVYNTLSISVLRRRMDIGTVRSLGASARAVFAVFLAEGAALGVVGSAFGLLLGVLLARGALAAVGGTVTELYLPSAHPRLTLDPGVLLSAFVVGVVASALSALAPAMEAARTEPAATLRHGSVEAARRKMTRPLAIVGVVLLGLAYLATRPGPVRGLPLWGFVSVFLVVAGASFLSPAAVTFVAGRLDPLAVRLLGVEARIARSNLTGSLSRTSVAVAALTMGVSMMVSVAVMVGSFRDTVARWVEESLSSDVFVSPASGRSGPSFGRLPEEAIETVRRVPGVADVDPLLGFGATRDGVPFTVHSGSFAYMAARGRLPLVDGREIREVVADALEKGEALVSEPYAVKFGVRAGDVVDLPTDRGPFPVRVAGVYTDYSNDRGTVTIDRALFRRLYRLSGAASLAVTLAPGVSPEEGQRRILVAAAGRFALRVRTNASLRKVVMRIFDRTFAVTYALEAVAIAVAVLGVLNTLYALVLERRREIGLLRVLGASAERVKKAVSYEATAIGGLGSALGLLSGGAMSLVLVYVINRQSFGWTIQMHTPWAFLTGAIALILATTVLAARHPARLAAATDAAAVLKEE